ncbi:serine protease 7 [Drosophila teissieri]|uniref:serine protease 7 n=1 Tax=Drosophila teissieri TaxID=7243 RepID=UPI001CBA461D|nr:serine protease 7 [Drosophila teissieri]
MITASNRTQLSRERLWHFSRVHRIDRSRGFRSSVAIAIAMKVIAVVLLCVLINRTAGTKYPECRNPNQRRGLCVSIYLCVPLNSVIAKGELTDSEKQFIFESRCASDQSIPPVICCTADKDYDRTADARLLPDRSICGGDVVHPQILHGTEALLTQYAWIALLEYRPPNGLQLRTDCAGSLINHRYVVTAAHCVSEGTKYRNGDLVSVRLGEHDTRTAVDCQMGVCLPSAVRIPVEQIHIHESYGSRTYWYDIALIRLARDVAYSPAIRPVCLPSTVAVQHWQAGQSFTVAGWGSTETSRRSPVKLSSVLTYVDPNWCVHTYSNSIPLGESHLCASGNGRGDSCEGDSGGPLMAFQEGVWVLGGIVSFGQECGSHYFPGVYSDVIFYDSWIKETMRP